MSKKKSIVSSFGQLSNLPVENAELVSGGKEPSQKPSKRVPAGVIGATQRSMTEIREERDRLLAEAEKGQQLLKLDPNDIEPSPFRDRLPDDDDDDYLMLKMSLKEEGQQIPISIRRHPHDEHRYQVAFGHRRWRALKELGYQVEARIGEFSDRDLVVAQGIENANRQDLSWIEKALFSAQMEKAGIKAKDIRAALSVDDAQLSKYRQVVRVLGIDIIEKIGRAARIGRPRWLDLIALVKGSSELAAIEKTLSDDKVLKMTSDERFMMALAHLNKSKGQKKSDSHVETQKIESFGNITYSKKDVRIVVDSKHAEQFKHFLQNEIEDLKDRFLKFVESE